MASTETSHPYAHVSDEKCYEWMLAQCSALEAARQAREDGLIATVTQISSAALLLIPGLFLSSGSGLPSVARTPGFYVSVLYFAIALLAAMTEQYLSGKANDRQIRITQAFYRKESDQAYDDAYVAKVRAARYLSYGFFLLAVIGTALSLSRL